MLNALSMTPNEGKKAGLKINQDGRQRTAFELLSYPDIGWQKIWLIYGQMLDELGTSGESQY